MPTDKTDATSTIWSVVYVHKWRLDVPRTCTIRYREAVDYDTAEADAQSVLRAHQEVVWLEPIEDMDEAVRRYLATDTITSA